MQHRSIKNCRSKCVSWDKHNVKSVQPDRIKDATFVQRPFGRVPMNLLLLVLSYLIKLIKMLHCDYNCKKSNNYYFVLLFCSDKALIPINKSLFVNKKFRMFIQKIYAEHSGCRKENHIFLPQCCTHV